MVYLYLLFFSVSGFFSNVPALGPTVNNTPALGPTGSIEIHVVGFNKLEGSVMASLFDSAEGFPGDPTKAVRQKVMKVDNDTLVLQFENLPYGIYAIVLFHDKNDNKKLDTNILGIPKEGMGTTNNTKPTFRAPKFEEAIFQLRGPVYRAEVQLIHY